MLTVRLGFIELRKLSCDRPAPTQLTGTKFMIQKIKHSRTLLENAIKNGVALNKVDGAISLWDIVFVAFACQCEMFAFYKWWAPFI